MFRSTRTVGINLCRTLQRSFFTYPKGELDSYKGIKLSTGNEIEGLQIVDDRGLIVGCYSTNVNVFSDLFARGRGLLGGFNEDYANMSKDASDYALQALAEEAKKNGANGVVDIHFESCRTQDPVVWSSNFGHCVAYGTMVVLKKK